MLPQIWLKVAIPVFHNKMLLQQSDRCSPLRNMQCIQHKTKDNTQRILTFSWISCVDWASQNATVATSFNIGISTVQSLPSRRATNGRTGIGPFRIGGRIPKQKRTINYFLYMCSIFQTTKIALRHKTWYDLITYSGFNQNTSMLLSFEDMFTDEHHFTVLYRSNLHKPLSNLVNTLHYLFWSWIVLPRARFTAALTCLISDTSLTD